MNISDELEIINRCSRWL